jgi:hypothetical protein
MNGVTQIVGSLFTYGLGSINTDRMFKYQVCVFAHGLTRIILTIT